MTLFLLDTNIVSDMMRDSQGRAARRAIQLAQVEPEARFHTSVIVDCELLYGLARKPQTRLQAAYQLAMGTLKILPLDMHVAQTYADLRHRLTMQGMGLDANDLLIAAHALSLNAILVSADAAFACMPGLQVENWLAESESQML